VRIKFVVLEDLRTLVPDSVLWSVDESSRKVIWCSGGSWKELRKTSRLYSLHKKS
jgi:hypothetical protein